jgi:hypothetical protein
MFKNRTPILTLMLALSAVTLRADECYGPKPMKVNAVCGRTAIIAGWIKQEPAYWLAEIFPDVPMELVDDAGVVVAKTMSDSRGRFEFGKVSKGKYVLRAPAEAGLAFRWPLVVTRSGASCSQPIYAYFAEPGWPCRINASLVKPAELNPPPKRN